MKHISRPPIFLKILFLVILLGTLGGCGVQAGRTEPDTNASVVNTTDLTEDEFLTLSSLEKVDEFPLYTMQYIVDYSDQAYQSSMRKLTQIEAGFWGCSLFAAMGNPEQIVFGRNFDWDYSPALMLYTNPDHGYASMSVVDIAYLGFDGEQSHYLEELPIHELTGLLDAPFLPFDGFNEAGLAVGMAAVPPGQMEPDPEKATVDSVMVIRKVLDQAATVEQAVDIFRRYNIDLGSGPPLHYLIADASGQSVLVEYVQGEIIAIPNKYPWHQATNFLVGAAGESLENHCWRYDQIQRTLMNQEGKLSPQEAMQLLAEVSQPSTQWSVVYDLHDRTALVVMGREYLHVNSLPLVDADP